MDRHLELDSTSKFHQKYALDRLFSNLKMQKFPGVGGGHPLPLHISQITGPTCDVPNTTTWV